MITPLFNIENATSGAAITINAPALFARADFQEWLNNPNEMKFTWHTPGEAPNEYSDVIVLVEPNLEGEGSNSEMPGWDELIETLNKTLPRNDHLYASHLVVRLTNLI